MRSDYLISKGFTKCISEQCMFIRNEGKEMILLYVDDAIISCETESMVISTIKEIKESFELGEEGPLDWYVGSAIEDEGTTVYIYIKRITLTRC
jgi:hypothetical protein